MVSPVPGVAPTVMIPGPHLDAGTAIGADAVPATDKVFAAVVPQPTTAYTLKLVVT